MNSVLPLAVCLLLGASNGQGPSSSHPLLAARPFPPAAGPMECGSRMGQGCAKSLAVNMNCVYGTYVDSCNECQCAKGPNEIFPFYRSVQGHEYLWQGHDSTHSLMVAIPSPPGDSAGPMVCGREMGQGCVQSIVDGMNCVHGTYVDVCNMCQCAKRPYSTGQVLGNPLQGPDSLHPLMVARPLPPAVSTGSMGCGSRIGQGCVQSIVGGMNCAHGTYVDMCNMCQCAKGPNETCGGAWGEHGRCTAKLHCFLENVTHFVGKCRLRIDG